jgi:hypothetical protein
MLVYQRVGYICLYALLGGSSQTWMQDAELQDFTVQVIQKMRGVMEKLPPASQDQNPC